MKQTKACWCCFIFSCVILAAMLATQLNDLVTSKEIEVKAVVQLDKYICNIIQETRLVWKVYLIFVQRMGFPKGWFTHYDLLAQQYQ